MEPARVSRARQVGPGLVAGPGRLPGAVARAFAAGGRVVGWPRTRAWRVR